jgi:hypothetical protein
MMTDWQRNLDAFGQGHDGFENTGRRVVLLGLILWFVRRRHHQVPGEVTALMQ